MSRARSGGLCAAAIAGVLIAAPGSPAVGQQTVPGRPDAANGLRLSQLLCSSCHIVGKNQQEPVPADVPSFFEIANLPDRTEETLVNYILVPHPKMPNVSLTRDELTDIVTYILTLKDKG